MNDDTTDIRSIYSLIAVTDKFRPVANGRRHAAGVYVVKLLGVGPSRLDVVNFEPDIRRNPVTVNIMASPCYLYDFSDIPTWLNCAKIVSKDL